VSNTNELVAFDNRLLGADGVALYARVGTAERAVSSPYFTGEYAVTHAPAPSGLTATGPAFAAVTRSASALRVSWSIAASFAEIALPNTEAAPQIPFGGGGPTCNPPTHFTGSGVQREDFAMARTQAGKIVTAYVRTQLDMQVSYAFTCMEGCFCVPHTDVDNSTATLNVVSVDPQTSTATTTHTLAIPPLQHADATPGVDGGRVIDARAYGDDVAIALRTRTDPQRGASVRVLRVHKRASARCLARSEPAYEVGIHLIPQHVVRIARPQQASSRARDERRVGIHHVRFFTLWQANMRQKLAYLLSGPFVDLDDGARMFEQPR
jgi:hypothetical protein